MQEGELVFNTSRISAEKCDDKKHDHFITHQWFKLGKIDVLKIRQFGNGEIIIIIFICDSNINSYWLCLNTASARSKQTKNCLSLPKQTEMRTSHCVEKYRAIVGEGVECAVAVFGASCLHAHALSVCYIYDSLSIIIQ